MDVRHPLQESDLNFIAWCEEYNLPMQTLQNVGALTASLGPLAGGYGYAGGAQPPAGAFSPNTGSLPGIAGLPGSIGYTPEGGMSPAPPIFGSLGGSGLGGFGFMGSSQNLEQYDFQVFGVKQS